MKNAYVDVAPELLKGRKLKTVEMLDRVDDAIELESRGEGGKLVRVPVKCKLYAGEHYRLVDFQADDLVAKGFAKAVKG